MDNKEYILYHGTLKKYWDYIEKDGYKFSTRDDNWLGKGVYFYDELYKATNWSKNKIKYNKESLKELAVIKNNISVLRKHILDLTDYECRKKYNRCLISCEKIIKISSKEKLSEEKRLAKKRCAFFDLISEDNDFYLIIAELQLHSDDQLNQILRGMGISVNNEVQYCLKKTSCIISKQLLKPEELIV